jgi:outer membrane protein
MKRLIVVSLMLVGMVVSAQQTKVGTIDVDFILSKMPDLEDVQKGVDAYAQTLKVDLDAKMAGMQQALQQYQSEEASLTIAQRKTRQDSILAMEDDINKYRTNSQQLILLKRDELMQPLYKKIGDKLEAIAQEQGYTQIFQRDNNLIYINNTFDVTMAVIEALGIKLEEGE